ncbi:MAG TPA: glycosyltransferase family 2 protein [Candidatus Acidoferrum sp.]|nr:glycosyltransferase family 2 protein [Candidatus Acidoferrum sp.]
MLVSAIIPARNEEGSIARAVESVAAQPEIGEVIVVNDQSTDRTAEILVALIARIPKLKVLETGALPSGWTGKNYAVSVGAAAARGDWLLFTDADTFHLPGSTAHALRDAKEHDAVLVSYSPEQEMETFWERALIPVVYCRLAQKYSYARVNDPDLPDAAANGQFLLIRRDVYNEIGGHAAVARQVLEDVALAEIVKNAGNRIFFSNPAGVVRARMYRSFRDIWDGWTKNLYLLFPDDFADKGEKRIFIAAAALLFAVTVFVKGAREHPILPYYCTLGVATVAAHLWYGVQLRRNHFPLSYIRYMFLGGWLFMVMRGVSWWKNTHGAVTWKGRAYTARSS